FDEADLIDGTELVKDYRTLAVQEIYADPSRVVSGRRGKRRDQNVAAVAIHLVGRNENARPSVLGIGRRHASGVYQKNGKAIYHCHSFWSKLAAAAAPISSSSSFSAIALNASSQPARGFWIFRIRMPSS